jgi:RNA polymerase sigma-70 factor, ECF subfamily
MHSQLLRYTDDLFGYAMALSRNRAEAEDLVQETYLRALKAMGGLRPDSNLKVWMFTILRNVWLNQLRKQRTGPRIMELDKGEASLDPPAERTKDPHSLLVSNMEREYVRGAIEQLPTDFREIVVLREYEELSYQEIAEFLGCPLGTVMSRLGRARAKLRILLSNALQSNPLRTD